MSKTGKMRIDLVKCPCLNYFDSLPNMFFILPYFLLVFFIYTSIRLYPKPSFFFLLVWAN